MFILVKICKLKMEIMFLLFLSIFSYSYGEEGNSTLFPVSDDILFDIWDKRVDLQNRYPEVKDDDLLGLKTWAIKYGWNEEQKLSSLIPEGKIPDYNNPWKIPIPYIPQNVGYEKYLPFIIIALVIGIGIFTTLMIFKNNKKIIED